MKEKDKNGNLSAKQSGKETKNISKGYPLYPESEDISRSVESTDEEEVLEIDESDDISDESNSDLDVPGSELDDDQEEVGSEDEENNYYSIGGDDHEDLDEDKEE